MASYGPGDSLGEKQRDSSTQARTVSKADSSPDPAAQHKKAANTEVPTVPSQIYHAFERPTPDPLAIGNPSLELALKLKGNLGHFVDRDKVETDPVFIELYPGAYRDSVSRTLKIVILRLLRLGGYVEVQDMDTISTEVATQLANGISIMTYLRLRRVNTLEATELNKFRKRPKVPEDLEIPAPYALAISHLGIVEPSSMITQYTLVPTISTATTNFCLPAGTSWSSASYLQAMEYGKKLGLKFMTVDLSVPLGSSWWLFRPDYTDGLFTLQCTLPEDNYTEQTAVLHTLFCANHAGGAFNEIFDLSPLDNHNYGTMLRSPPSDINVTSYFAIDETVDNIWKVV